MCATRMCLASESLFTGPQQAVDIPDNVSREKSQVNNGRTYIYDIIKVNRHRGVDLTFRRCYHTMVLIAYKSVRSLS